MKPATILPIYLIKPGDLIFLSALKEPKWREVVSCAPDTRPNCGSLYRLEVRPHTRPDDTLALTCRPNDLELIQRPTQETPAPANSVHPDTDF